MLQRGDSALTKEKVQVAARRMEIFWLWLGYGQQIEHSKPRRCGMIAVRNAKKRPHPYPNGQA